MKFKITINDNEYHADMVDCDLVNQIADMCPFEVTFKQHRNQEYFTKLPSQANDDGCPLTTTFLRINYTIISNGMHLSSFMKIQMSVLTN